MYLILEVFFMIFVPTEEIIERNVKIISNENQIFQWWLNIAAFIASVISKRDVQMIGETMCRNILLFSDGVQTLWK